MVNILRHKVVNLKRREVVNLDGISTLVDYILLIKKNGSEKNILPSISNKLIIKQLEDIINGMVLELYFEEEMKAKKVNIIELVETELHTTKSESEVESIYNFYHSISNPNSEICKRIFLFPTASPDILKPILQD